MNIQDKFNKPNVIYKITKDIDLGGETLTIPEGCTLDFQGGSIKNGVIAFNNTLLQGDVKITSNFIGLIRNEHINVLWFGVKNDGTIDASSTINNIIKSIYNSVTNFVEIELNVSKTLYFPDGQYLFENSVEILNDKNINGVYSTVNIIGESKGATLIYSNTDGIQGLFRFSGSNYNRIENMTLMSHKWGLSSRNVGKGLVAEKWCNQIFINNIVCRGFDTGLDVNCQASSIRDVMARDCKVGFNIYCTSVAMIGCYAGGNKTEEGDGIGYIVSAFYSSLLNCASDSNNIGYKLVNCVSVSLNECGAEGNDTAIHIEPTISSYHQKISVIDCPLNDVNNKLPIYVNNKDAVVSFINQTLDLSREFIQYGPEARRDIIYFENCKTVATISNTIINKYPLEYGKDYFKILPFEGDMYKANKEFFTTANDTQDLNIEGDLYFSKKNGQFLSMDVSIKQLDVLSDAELSEDINVRIAVSGYSDTYCFVSYKTPEGVVLQKEINYEESKLHYIITVPAGYYKRYGNISVKGMVTANYSLKDFIKSTMS